MFPTIVFILLSTPCTSICSLVWTVLKTYSIEPLQDQYDARKTTRCPRPFIKFETIGCMWRFRLSIIKRNDLPGRLASTQSQSWHVTDESIQISPPLREAPVEWERLTCLLVAWYCHSKLTLPSPFLYLPLASHRFSLVTFPYFLFCVSNLLLLSSRSMMSLVLSPYRPSGIWACQYCWRLKRFASK
jgi:hypothetical protein